jgi:hypothetical protein
MEQENKKVREYGRQGDRRIGREVGERKKGKKEEK